MKVIKVEWVDSNITHGWQPEGVFEGAWALCESVGYLYEETSELISLAMGRSDHKSILETLTLPKACIKSIKEMRVK